MIEFQDVTKKFGEKVVLDGLNLKIPDGRITFILGKSGEGKSVTIKHIVGLMRPTSGTILVDDEDITLKTQEELRVYRKKFGMLFQHAALFDSMSVKENILFPLLEHERDLSEAEMLERMEEVLLQVGLPDFEEKYPSALSIGEKKRVGLARALVTRPRVMLYDEPTTGMDPLVSEMIDELIVRLNGERQEMTSIVISHDLKAALATGENIVMLYKGRVILEGPPDSFRHTKDPIVRQFFSGKVEGPMEFL